MIECNWLTGALCIYASRWASVNMSTNFSIAVAAVRKPWMMQPISAERFMPALMNRGSFIKAVSVLVYAVRLESHRLPCHTQ